MKKFFLLLFILLFATELFFVVIGKDEWRYFTKPLLMPCLGGYFLSNTTNDPFRKWVLLALFFSWAGDILLMLPGDIEKFFLFGLVAFLIAHLFYITYFHFVRVREAIKSRWWLLLIVALYYGGLIFFLSPYLGSMMLPVRIYGAVISFMFLLALHMLFINDRLTGLLMMLGAMFFVMSDSILAINKFYQSFQLAGLCTMFTYGLAQLLITEGAIRYNKSALQKNN